jgi:hypothetical protein
MRDLGNLVSSSSKHGKTGFEVGPGTLTYSDSAENLRHFCQRIPEFQHMSILRGVDVGVYRKAYYPIQVPISVKMLIPGLPALKAPGCSRRLKISQKCTARHAEYDEQARIRNAC